MNYTVTWKRSAEDGLARIWLDAPNQQAIADAAYEIDQVLHHNPMQQGESRTRTIRILFCGPLGCFFHVNRGDRVVSVLRVWRTK